FDFLIFNDFDMKWIINNIIILAVISFTLVSCKDFLERNPTNEIGSTEFMRSEADLELYANGFLQRRMPDEETLAWGDQYSDNIATRASTDFLIGDNWTPNEQGSWGA